MVTDKDREAAANVAHLCGWSGTIQHDMRHGVCEGIAHEYPDQVALVQAFAAHREAAIAERDAQLVKWLHSQKTCGCKGEHGWCNADSQLQLIADAILPIITRERERAARAALDAAVRAHARTLADFEAHKRTVSDVVSGYNAMWHKFTPSRDTFMQHFGGFMIREPADPLADALVETFPRANGAEGMAQDIRQALAKRGLKIVEDNQ